MRRLLFLLRSVGILLRRRACSGPLLVLVLALLSLSFRTLMMNRTRTGIGTRPWDEETRSFISCLEHLQSHAQVQLSLQTPLHRPRAVVLMGQHLLSETGVQLYQRVLQQMGYEVHMSRYAETSGFLRTGVSQWSLVLCLGSSEQSCLRRIDFSRLQQHQMVNLIPGMMEAFSDAGGGLCNFYIRHQLTEADLPMKQHSCGSTNNKLPFPLDRYSPGRAPSLALVAMVNVYVVVTSVMPLTSFIHDLIIVLTNQQQRGRSVKTTDFLQHLGPTTSHQALGNMKWAIGQVLLAALTNEEQESVGRCVSCFQMFTFTLLFSGSITPIVIQVDTEFTFSALGDEAFQRQITKDQILEDTLQFLLSSRTHLSSRTQRKQYGGCTGTLGDCLSHQQLLLLLHLQQRLKKPSMFQLLYPSSSCSSSATPSISDLLLRISCYYELQTNSSRANDADRPTNQQPASLQHEGACVDPRLRQIYTDPPLILTPPFSPSVKEYYTKVTFDMVTVWIRPEPISSTCRVHLDEQSGPRMVNYPIGLGDGRISILVTDGAGQMAVVMAIYTVHVHRDSRPSMPVFRGHVTCGFVQDCGLPVQPGVSCGLQPHFTSQNPVQTCSSGHVPGRWLVPCLSCSDNRTCDWREVAWQPDGCYHPVVSRPLLQDCMSDRKVLFIGDSTNRGMMFYLMEQVNASLEDWGKAHDTLVYRNLNRERTQVSYSYYPQFWLDREQRPTFIEALQQLLARSRPLDNSNLTVLVVGGVQWLNINHLRTVQEVLDRESLSNILVVVKSLGLGFHLPVDGVRSLSLAQIQNLFRENENIVAAAKHHGYEVIDTFSITVGRYKEFLQGRCACHFHEVEKIRKTSDDSKPLIKKPGPDGSYGPAGAGPGPEFQHSILEMEQETDSNPQLYHVRGPVNQVYSEILLSRLCPTSRDGKTR